MSQKVLRWDHKHGSEFYDASTPEKEAAAFLQAFREMDAQEFYYFDLEEDEKEVAELHALKEIVEKGQIPSSLMDAAQEKIGYLSRKERELREDQRQKALYDKAKQGDSKAAHKLLDIRRDYEYENWSFEYVIDPLVPKEKEDHGK